MSLLLKFRLEIPIFKLLLFCYSEQLIGFKNLILTEILFFN